jgi:hypothetical protein
MSESYIDADERAAVAAGFGATGHWAPECWSKSPEQLVEEARAKNEAAFDLAVAHGGKHSHG